MGSPGEKKLIHVAFDRVMADENAADPDRPIR